MVGVRPNVHVGRQRRSVRIFCLKSLDRVHVFDDVRHVARNREDIIRYLKGSCTRAGARLMEHLRRLRKVRTEGCAANVAPASIGGDGRAYESKDDGCSSK